MSIESILTALTPAEKLAAIDFLWRDLSSNPSDVVSPDWHGEVLTERVANPSDKPRLTIDDAITEVKERLNARRTQG